VRVAFVTTSYPAFPGDGSGHFVATEASRRAAHDEVFVVAPTLEDDAFGWPGVLARVRARPLLVLDAARWARRARRKLASLPALDRIVAHWAVPSGWPISTGLGPPLELVSHGADVRLLVSCPAPVRHAIVERLLRDADVWRFVSSSLLDGLLSSLDVHDAGRLRRIAKVEACPIEVPDVREPALEKRALHAGMSLVVCVARLVASKRVDRVIDHMAARRHTRSRLVVVGDGPLRASLENRARRLGVDAVFVGQTTRPVALSWIGAADEVLHASEAEGLSTVEREARALGVPFRFIGCDAVCMDRDLR
jgi:teichuronic acid biosynthesis glycosyltransferase TuaC